GWTGVVTRWGWRCTANSTPTRPDGRRARKTRTGACCEVSQGRTDVKNGEFTVAEPAGMIKRSGQRWVMDQMFRIAGHDLLFPGALGFRLERGYRYAEVE